MVNLGLIFRYALVGKKIFGNTIRSEKLDMEDTLEMIRVCCIWKSYV